MTEVEYTEKALDNLENLDPLVADRVMNKVNEATEWTEHRLERLSGYPNTRSVPGTIERSFRGIEMAIGSGSKRSVIAGTSTIGTSLRELIIRHLGI